MTRPELHELVDIVMDARERTKADLKIRISDGIDLFHYEKYYYITSNNYYTFITSNNYYTFPDFIQAVKEYIEGLG